ncbi:MAG: D-lyxose/D-mannose family sugar isomerase [Capsulimonadaceae bacterium]|nr:D-lyxose/D-mannose family sugar isomerase [Capsulimonadaceae bacterium]
MNVAPIPINETRLSILKRSQINASIEQAIDVFAANGLHLPPYAYLTPEQWRQMGSEADEIRHCLLGWDVTDFGSGDFARIGRTLFTLRNGRMDDPRYPKSYAEKFLLDPEGQRAPAHFHRSKREDIIHRGKSGAIILELTPTNDAGIAIEQPLRVQVNGMTRTVQPRERIRLSPGESLEIPPRTIHQFWGEEGGGITASGEVSSVCDDWNDNCFVDPAKRFPKIEEDVPRRFYLCQEYPAA